MRKDLNALRRHAPLALPVAIVAVGWLLLVSPAASDSARVAQENSLMQQRLAQVRASLAEPPPAPVSGNPAAAFERRVAARDVSSQVLEQLARLASSAPVSNLLIETGDRVTVAAGTGPRAAGGDEPDPRFGLFDVALAYSPISMSFDAEFSHVGEFLWAMRDLATTVEIRSLGITPAADNEDGARRGLVHVTLSLFAYARDDGSDAVSWRAGRRRDAAAATTGVAR